MKIRLLIIGSISIIIAISVMPNSIYGHPEIDYTKSMIKFSDGTHMHLTPPETKRSTIDDRECDLSEECIVIVLIMIIIVVMSIVILFVYRKS